MIYINLVKGAIMKKNIIDYYALIMMILFIIYNTIFKDLKIGGLLYQIFMVVLIVLNITILMKFRKRIKLKGLIIVIYFVIWFIFSKNTLQCFFAISNMIILIAIGFMESNFIKVLSILIGLFFVVFSMPLFFAFLLTYGTGISEESGRNDVHDDMHFYCENNYEVYSYSAGAMDRFHYSVGKHYEFLDIDGIIYISYNERKEVSQEEYNNYLNTHKCKLVGDVSGSK